MPQGPAISYVIPTGLRGLTLSNFRKQGDAYVANFLLHGKLVGIKAPSAYILEMQPSVYGYRPRIKTLLDPSHARALLDAMKAICTTSSSLQKLQLPKNIADSATSMIDLQAIVSTYGNDTTHCITARFPKTAAGATELAYTPSNHMGDLPPPDSDIDLVIHYRHNCAQLKQNLRLCLWLTPSKPGDPGRANILVDSMVRVLRVSKSPCPVQTTSQDLDLSSDGSSESSTPSSSANTSFTETDRHQAEAELQFDATQVTPKDKTAKRGAKKRKRLTQK